MTVQEGGGGEEEKRTKFHTDFIQERFISHWTSVKLISWVLQYVVRTSKQSCLLGGMGLTLQFLHHVVFFNY